MEHQTVGFLFDLDGVIIDTESGYDQFWGDQMRRAFPSEPELFRKIKGQTLTEIYNRYFPDPSVQERITAELNAFERDMPMPWVEGFVEFAESIRRAGYQSCVVTSSNQPKMQSVYRQHPELRSLMDFVLSSEDFHESKPAPECYLVGAARLGLKPEQCIAFEDSLNGLKSAWDAGTHVVGLTTSLSAEVIKDRCHLTCPNFKNIDLAQLVETLMITKR